MASGFLGSGTGGGTLSYSSGSQIFSASTTTTLILSCCNRTAAAINISIAVVPASETATTGTVADAYLIEKDFPLNANTSFERTGITLGPNDRLMAVGASTGVTFVAYGLES